MLRIVILASGICAVLALAVTAPAQAGGIYYSGYSYGGYAYPAYPAYPGYPAGPGYPSYQGYPGYPGYPGAYPTPTPYVVAPAPAVPVTVNSYYVAHAPYDRCAPMPLRDGFGNVVWSTRAGCP